MAAQYPTAAGADANLFIAKNNLSCVLSGAHNSAVTTITVNSTTNFPTTGYITIDAEAISYTGTTGTTFTGCTRGADGTSAASHLDTAQVIHTVVASHHNVLKDEIIAVEGDLVSARAAITSGGSTLTSALTAVQTQLTGKQATGNYITALTGDVAASGPGSAAATISAATVTGKLLTGLATSAGTITASDSILTAINKIAVARVVQVVTATVITNTTTTSSSFTSTVLTASITPKATGNSILIIAQGSLGCNSANNAAVASIFEGSTNLGDASLGSAYHITQDTSTNSVPCTLIAYHSPATTSATTYTVKIKSANGVATANLGQGETMTMILIEIGA